MKQEVRRPKIDALLLGEHFNSIRTTMLEIRNFREKKFTPTPTFEFSKIVDIEETWPDCRDRYIQIFRILNDIAGRFMMDLSSFYENDGFTEAIDAFVTQLDTITVGLGDALGTGHFSPEELQECDRLILTIQHNANLMRTYVLTEFVYSAEPTRD